VIRFDFDRSVILVREAEHVAALTPGSHFAACMARLREPADQAIAALQ